MIELAPPFLQRILNAGYQLSPDAYTYLTGLPSELAENIVSKAIISANQVNQPIFLLDKDFIIGLVETTSPIKVNQEQQILPAKTLGASIKIFEEEPAKPVSDSAGFTAYFRNRFERLESILKRRVDVRDSIPLSQALKSPTKSKLKTIGIVTEKKMRGNKLFLDLEDSYASITVMASDEEIVRKGLEIQEDQVICIDALKYSDDLFIVNEWIWPDIPQNTPRRSVDQLYAALIADVHVGSKYFRRDLFEKFIKWLSLEIGSPKSQEYAARVKYLIIAGDLVDGVGIYPEQLEELEITTIRDQYRAAHDLLKEIPEHIEIGLLPGNHDASRHSMPQPPIPKEFAESLWDDPRIRMMPSPSRVSLNGVEILIEHGKGLDDILNSTPGYNFKHPIKAMELLFKCRHLAPRYGQTTPIAPELTDRLVINNVPDVFLMGHVHINETKRYKGVTFLSAGSWQSQTPFQKRMQIEPTTGIASILDLQTHAIYPLDTNQL